MSRFSIAAAMLSAAVAPVVFAQVTGPSSSQSPYVLPTTVGVTTKSILTVGDSIGGYKLVGIPDGLGAWDAAANNGFNLVVNHELGGTVGAVRAHGQTGSFVSRWNIDKATLAVNSGRDHNTSPADAYEYSSTTGTWSNTPSLAQRWNRFCSGDLPAVSAFYDASSGLGTQNRIFMGGEEAGEEGRAYGHIVTGASVNQSWQLPSLGKFSWENSVASPKAQQKTVVVGLDDSTPGQVYVYVGNKGNTGNDIDKAGLTNGSLYGIKTNTSVEAPGSPIFSRFSLQNLGDVKNGTGAALTSASNAAGVTNFLRPEDGAWDPRPGKENDFYFVTTHQFNGRTRLYRVRFDDINDPTLGGEVTPLLDGGSSGVNMMDNICVDSQGRVIIQEDIGGQDPLGKIWLYDIDTNTYGQIAQHDPARFGIPAGPGFLTRDEEASGIIDASDILGPNQYLLDVQAHYGLGGELVEGGQLLAMTIAPSAQLNLQAAPPVPEPASLSLLAVGGLLLRRRR